MILLNDLLNFDKERIKRSKIKFNQDNHYDDPIELYKTDPNRINEQWLFWRAKNRYFDVGQIAICLAKIDSDHWLLTTIKEVTEELDVIDGVNYKGKELEEYSQYYGRVIIKFHKASRSQCYFLEKLLDELEVAQILPDIFDDDDFPGYDKVKLSYNKLAAIINRGKKDWIAALENQKAVYLITDNANGKLYVGSATSDYGMLLQRWKSYISNGHGGNKELVKLVEEKGFNYIKQNFQYSILENYNSKVDDSIIRDREKWWKEILQTKKFGYNDN